MRLFIALPLSSGVRNEMVNLQEQMRQDGVQGNYSLESNLHITLAFIGEYEDPNDVIGVMSQIDFPGFSLSLEGLGNFRNLYYAKVEDSPGLADYVSSLKAGLKQAGIPFDDHRFFPHITLIRKAQVPEGFDLQVPGFTFSADRAVLYESTRVDGVLTYVPLYTRFPDKD